MFKHLTEIIHTQKISERSTLTPEVVSNLVNAFHTKNFSAYKGRGEFVSVGELVLKCGIRIIVKIDPKSEFVFADFFLGDLYLCPELWQYTGSSHFYGFYLANKDDRYNSFVETLLSDLERAVVYSIYNGVITEKQFVEFCSVERVYEERLFVD